MQNLILLEYAHAIASLTASGRGGGTASGLDGPFQPINAGGLGGFPWQWSMPLGFNYATYLFVNHCFSQGEDGVLVANDPYSTAFSTVLNNISFKLSSADLATLNKASTLNQIPGQAVVSTYIQFIAPIAPSSLTQASAALNREITSSLDYILLYQVAYVWSGKKAAGQAPLTTTFLSQQSDLSSVLPAAPSAAKSLLSTVQAYLQSIQQTLHLLDSIGNGNFLLSLIKRNLFTPNDQNGGLLAVDSDGSTVTVPGFEVSPDPATILNALNQVPVAPLNVRMDATQSQVSSAHLNVAFNQQGNVLAPANFFQLLQNNGNKHTLFSLPGTGNQASVQKIMPGQQVVSIRPMILNEAAEKGWYSNNPLSEAFQNGAKDVSGFFFQPPPGYDLRSGGNFGLLGELLISQFPTVEINYPQGDANTFRQQVTPNQTWNFQLAGLPKFGGDEFMYHMSQIIPASQGFTVQFTPIPSAVSRGILGELAYVIGARLIWVATS